MLDHAREAMALVQGKTRADLDSDRFMSVFRARIDALDAVAGKMYDMYATVVDVIGSDKHELFEVERLQSGQTHVCVYKTNKDGERRKLLFDRLFRNSEISLI